METSVVQEVPFTPNCCAFCRSHNPPYVLTRINRIEIHTPDGARLVNGTVAVCVGDQDKPGCLTTLARAAGGKGPQDVAFDEAQLAEERERHSDRIKNLELELGDAIASQGPQVVRVDELLERLPS